MSGEEPPPDPSSSSLEAPKPSGGETSGHRLQARGPSAGALVSLVAPSLENRTYDQLFSGLLEAELSIDFSQLSAGEYLVMILMYFIQNRSVEGRFALVRALDRYKDHPVFLSLMNMAESLAEENLSAALLELHNVGVDQSFEPYLTELKNRVLVRRLRQLLCAYSVISFKDFSQSLGFPEPNDKVRELLQQIQWPLSADNFVEPKKTDAFKELLRSVCHEEFGTEETREEQKAADTGAFSIENLKRLAKYADILDREL